MTGRCVFCRILAGDGPASMVYQDDTMAAFMDLYPVHAGHTLIVPRRHVTDLAACPSELAGHLFQLSARLGPAIVRAVSGDGFNVWTANGAAAGQEVFHLHLHVLPRFADDTFGLRFPKDYPRQADRTQLDALAAKIRALV